MPISPSTSRTRCARMMKEGRSDAEIKTFMTERYGDFVLYRPPVKATTWVLWVGPFVLLAAAVAGLFAYLRRRRAAIGTEAVPLTSGPAGQGPCAARRRGFAPALNRSAPSRRRDDAGESPLVRRVSRRGVAHPLRDARRGSATTDTGRGQDLAPAHLPAADPRTDPLRHHRSHLSAAAAARDAAAGLRSDPRSAGRRCRRSPTPGAVGGAGAAAHDLGAGSRAGRFPTDRRQPQSN